MMGARECLMYSKNKKLTPEEIEENLKNYTDLLDEYSTVFSICKSEVLHDFELNGENFKKGTCGLVLGYDSNMEYLEEDLSFFLEDYEYYIKDSNLGEDDELTYEDEI